MNKIKSLLSFLKTKHLYLGIARYLLGIFMLTYSLTKILKTQFVLPNFVWTEPQTLESIAGKQLAWAFLGYSGWFQVLLGVLELIPAILLLFKRTTLLGAILMLPVTLNVVLINYALNLWDSTKILSSILLFLNLLVFIFVWDQVKAILLTIIGEKLRKKFNPIEILINITLIGAVSFFALKSLLTYTSQTNSLTGDWLNQRPIEWILESEECQDSLLAHRDAKLYFWALGMCKEVGDFKEESPTSYTIDEQNHELSLKFDNDESLKCSYSFHNERLKIEMTKNQSKITQYYRKRIINQDRN